MVFRKTWGAIFFALSWTMIAKYYPLVDWLEEHSFISLPLMIVGLAMLFIDWERKGGEG